MKDLAFSSYDYYSGASDMELVSRVVESLKQILEDDKKQARPLFLKISDNLVHSIAKKAIHERAKTFIVGITGESASGKTVFVDNTIAACVKENRGVYTVIRCDDYYKDTSKELQDAGSYEALFKTGFSFDTPDVIDLELMKTHIMQLKNGETTISPAYDFVTCESNPDGEIKTPATVILTEGLYVLNENVRDIIDIKVYVFTPLEVIKDRWYKRAELRGKTGEAADLQFADVNKTAQQYIRPNYETADAVINGCVSEEYIREITDKIFHTLHDIVS